MIWIWIGNSQWIEKDGRCFIEGHSVIQQIDICLGRIPFVDHGPFVPCVLFHYGPFGLTIVGAKWGWAIWRSIIQLKTG